MENKLRDVFVPKGQPFVNDLCNRSDTSYILKTTIEAFAKGCVISLNGKWGSGKTTFLNMWEQYMQEKEYKIIHFNAWEDDYMDDPLLSIISTFYNIVGSNMTEDVKNKFLKSVSCMLHTVPFILSRYIEYKTGIDVKDVTEKVGNEILSNLKETFENYSKRKNTIDDFKKVLKEYVSNYCKDKPLIYVIDELDRCNPTYAVKTLERIKHLFAVENIVFVIAIDNEQLCNSIKGYFGSERFDADNYLKRFFDLQYDLPKSNSDKIVNSAMERFGYSSHSFKRIYSFDRIYEFVSYLYETSNLSIRELEKYLLYSKIVLNKNNSQFICDITFMFLVYLKMFDNVWYKKLIDHGVKSNEDFVFYIEENYLEYGCRNVTGYIKRIFNILVVELLLSINNKDDYEKLLVDNENNLMFRINKLNENDLIEDFNRFKIYDYEINDLRRLVDLVDSYNFTM